jgi:outer membrane biosynthesis protein TonB
MSHDFPVRTTGTRSRISSETLAGDNRSPLGFAASLLLHGAIVAGTLFTFSHTLEISDQSPPVVPVDLVTIAPKTNVRATVRPQPHIAPEPTPPVPKVMPTPTPPQPQPVEEKPQETAEPIAAPTPRPILRHKPKPPEEQPKEKEEKKSFDVDKVLALLNKVAPSQQAAAPNARSAARTVRGIGAQTAMTADLQDALRSQIQPCWSPPVGAPHPERLVVSFDLFLNPDGSVAQPPQLTGDSASAASRDPFVQAAAEAARRAIYTCAPFKLPADRYQEWREINPFIFDPRNMLGQ